MDEATWKAFGEWVEQLRVRSGLQVGEVAERAGVSRVWLQEIRNGGRGVPGGWRLPNPKHEALVRLARVLNVPPETMLARAGRGAALGNAETSQPTGRDNEEREPDAHYEWRPGRRSANPS